MITGTCGIVIQVGQGRSCYPRVSYYDSSCKPGWLGITATAAVNGKPNTKSYHALEVLSKHWLWPKLVSTLALASQLEHLHSFTAIGLFGCHSFHNKKYKNEACALNHLIRDFFRPTLILCLFNHLCQQSFEAFRDKYEILINKISMGGNCVWPLMTAGGRFLRWWIF